MRYPLAKAERLGTILTASGALSSAVGLASALARRALGPLAVPLAVGGGLMWLGRKVGDGFVEIGDEELRIQLGVLFDERIPLRAVRAVEPTKWSLLGGLGIRSNARDRVAVTTAAGSVAELTLEPPQRLPVLPGLWWIEARRLVVSPEDVDGFIAELRARI